MYEWPVYVSLLGLNNLADIAGNKRLLVATADLPQRALLMSTRHDARPADRPCPIPSQLAPLACATSAGVSAVEFAMLLPLMITLYLGGVEVSRVSASTAR